MANPDNLPVAVIVGATSKWQSDGRNTLLVHGQQVDDSELPVGARWGVGGAVAQRFAAEGCHVVLTTRTRANAEPLAAAIQAQGGSCQIVELDLVSVDSISTAFASIRAEAGDPEVLVYNAGYRPLDQGGAFPAMFQDVACAVAAARADAPSAGGSGHTTVVGFSAGAHLASVVALAPSEFAGACTPPRVDAFAGISGPYDSDQFPFLALQFGGLQRDVPAAWAAGNPYTYIGRNPDLDVLLIHGEDDVVVDPGFSTEFAEALRQAGYGVQLHTVPGAGHFSIIEPDESGGPTAEVVATFVLDRAG